MHGSFKQRPRVSPLNEGQLGRTRHALVGLLPLVLLPACIVAWIWWCSPRYSLSWRPSPQLIQRSQQRAHESASYLQRLRHSARPDAPFFTSSRHPDFCIVITTGVPRAASYLTQTVAFLLARLLATPRAEERVLVTVVSGAESPDVSAELDGLRGLVRVVTSNNNTTHAGAAAQDAPPSPPRSWVYSETLSYAAALEEGLKHPCPYVLVIEDDAIATVNLLPQLIRIKRALGGPESRRNEWQPRPREQASTLSQANALRDTNASALGSTSRRGDVDESPQFKDAPPFAFVKLFYTEYWAGWSNDLGDFCVLLGVGVFGGIVSSLWMLRVLGNLQKAAKLNPDGSLAQTADRGSDGCRLPMLPSWMPRGSCTHGGPYRSSSRLWSARRELHAAPVSPGIHRTLLQLSPTCEAPTPGMFPASRGYEIESLKPAPQQRPSNRFAWLKVGAAVYGLLVTVALLEFAGKQNVLRRQRDGLHVTSARAMTVAHMYPRAHVAALGEHLRLEAVSEQPVDLLVDSFFALRGLPVFEHIPHLFQHIGVVSSSGYKNQGDFAAIKVSSTFLGDTPCPNATYNAVSHGWEC